MDMKNFDEEIKNLNNIKDPDEYLTKTIEIQDELSKENTKLNKESDDLFYQNQDLKEKLNKLMKSCEKKQNESEELGQKKAEIDAKINELKADPVYSEKPALKAKLQKSREDIQKNFQTYLDMRTELSNVGVTPNSTIPKAFMGKVGAVEGLGAKLDNMSADLKKQTKEIEARLKEIGDESGEKYKAIKAEINKLEKESNELGEKKDLIYKDIVQMEEELGSLAAEINKSNDRLKEIEAAIDKNNACQEAVSAAYKQSRQITDEVFLEAGKSGHAANLLEEAKDEVVTKAVIEASDPAAVSSYIDAMKETNNDLKNDKAEIKNALFSENENTAEKDGAALGAENMKDKSAGLFKRLKERFSNKRPTPNPNTGYGEDDQKRNKKSAPGGGPSGH